jgi:hypothetical protein
MTSIHLQKFCPGTFSKLWVELPNIKTSQKFFHQESLLFHADTDKWVSKTRLIVVTCFVNMLDKVNQKTLLQNHIIQSLQEPNSETTKYRIIFVRKGCLRISWRFLGKQNVNRNIIQAYGSQKNKTEICLSIQTSTTYAKFVKLLPTQRDVTNQSLYVLTQHEKHPKSQKSGDL